MPVNGPPAERKVALPCEAVFGADGRISMRASARPRPLELACGIERRVATTFSRE